MEDRLNKHTKSRYISLISIRKYLTIEVYNEFLVDRNNSHLNQRKDTNHHRDSVLWHVPIELLELLPFYLQFIYFIISDTTLYRVYHPNPYLQHRLAASLWLCTLGDRLRVIGRTDQEKIPCKPQLHSKTLCISVWKSNTILDTKTPLLLFRQSEDAYTMLFANVKGNQYFLLILLTSIDSCVKVSVFPSQRETIWINNWINQCKWIIPDHRT